MARERLAEVVEVYGSASRLLHGLIARIDDGDGDVPKKLVAQLATLQELFVKIRKSEEVFHERYGDGLSDGQVDMAAIRAEIGRKLDRIRDAG